MARGFQGLSGKSLMSRRTPEKKVFTENVNILKGLSATPDIPKHDADNYYVEPVSIEYYIPKESRFAYQIKYLYIKLFDPVPKNETQEKIMAHFKSLNRPIDVMEVMNEFPQYLMEILNYYNANLHMYESMSLNFQEGYAGNDNGIKKALYISEVLRKFEPTIPSLEIIGDYTVYNINWCVRELNRRKVNFSLEDPTVEFLIKRYKVLGLAEGNPPDERFELLADIYMEQAFPYSDEDLLRLEMETGVVDTQLK